MNKKVLTAMMLCASLFSLSAFAQNPNARAQKAPQTKCATSGKVCDAPQECPAQRAMLLFDGTTLTADQQARIKELNKTRAEKKRTAMKEAGTEARAEKRAARQQRDSIMKAEKREYLTGIKEILTPEQYVIFLENAYVTPAPQQGPRMAQNNKMKVRGDKQGVNRNAMAKKGNAAKAKKAAVATEVKAAN